MMMGLGSYGNGGGCSSSPSNLSALAPPFTVDRSVSKPLVDLTEPPLNWLNTHPLSFDSLHSSHAYGYSFNPPSSAHLPPPENTVPITSTDSFAYGQNFDAIPTTNLVEAKICYPSYASPSKYTYDDYAQSLSGLWEGSRGWEFGKKDELGKSFCSKEMNVPDLSIYNRYADQGVHSSKGVNMCEENTNIIDMLGSQQHRGSTKSELIDYKSFPGQISEFMPVEYSGKSVLGSTSLFPKTCSLLSCEQGRSRNHQIPYGASHEKDVKQRSISQNDISSVMMSSPGLIIRSQAVGSGPSAPNTSSFNNLATDIDANNTDFSINDNFSKMKEFHPLQGSEGHFDASQVSFSLGGGIHCFQESPLEKREKIYSNVNVINDPLREKYGLQIPDIGPGCFSLTPASNGALNCLEGSSECLDHYCHSVDSPCWKGSSDCHFSPLENFGPVTPPHIKEIGGSNSIGPTDNSVKFSCQKASDYLLYQENGCLENASESFPKRPSLSNLFFEEPRTDLDLKAGSYDMKSSCGLGVQFSGYVDKARRGYVLANNAVDEFKIKSFPMQQNGVEDKLTFDKKCEWGTGVTDVGMSTNDTSEGCSSHMLLHATGHAMTSPSSVEAAPSKLTKLQDEELAPQKCVQTLISTMHNLSELLLFHCSNEVCELKENDLEALKQVVNNLDKCISKTMELEAPLQESLLAQKSTQIIRELPELHQDGTRSSPHDSKTAFSVLNQFNYQHVQEERVHHTISGQKNEKCSNFTSQGGDAVTVKDDNMTQAIKKVLSENFVEEEDDKLQILLYKNLWLEAEAALCSINYKARFDRMKIELEKCTLKAKENTPEMEKPSECTFSPDRNTVNELPPEVKVDSTQDFSVQDFPVVNTSSHPGEIVARFHILKGLESNANRRTTTDIEKLSNYSTSADMGKVDKMESEAKNDQTPHISTCSLPNSSSTSCAESADDVEASVMARFHILRSRFESSSCENVGDGLLSQVMGDRLHSQVADLGFAGRGKNMTEDGTLDVNTESVLQQNSANHTEDELPVKEFYLHVKDDPMIQSSWMNSLGNQLPASSNDSSSSDWEHVLKEDLPA